eukprot:TRINITY_DN13180_c0_g1_i2.p1 TRINITY_DN13180_c0_g1~~TRINITY_DN13180_c0_g1_i2.p1  ORF type:complete len:299 (+),score=62.39 TRINITY_DN13180_c0_g1_i2:143-1039(+)
MKSYKRSQTGSLGVYFVETASGIVVLKGARGEIQEMIFSTFLAYLFGIFCPRFRIVRVTSEENQEMFGEEASEILRGCQGVDASGGLRHLFSNQFIVVQEFIKGKTLSEFEYVEMMDLFGSEIELNLNAERRLKDLGVVLVYDVLVNNTDRLPLIWDNQGNSGNLMLDDVTGQVITLDNTMATIDPERYPDKCEMYLNRVRHLLESLSEREGLIPEFEHVGRKLLEFTQFNFQEAGVSIIQDSFKETIRNIRDLNLDENTFKEWKDLINSLEISEDNQINVDFLMRVINIFVEFSDKL